MLRVGWRTVLSDPDFLGKMQNHCVLCHQWVSLKGPGTKQHLRLSHAKEWQFKDDANSLCSSAGSVAASPCAYCNGTFQDPRTHVKRCPVAFQAALSYLCLAQEDGARGRGQITGSGPPGDEGCLGGGHSAPKAGAVGTGGKQEATGGGSRAGSPGQVEQASLQRTSGEGTVLGWRRLEDMGASSPGAADGQCHSPPPSHSCQDNAAIGRGT